jgi:hypothetical protein
MDVRLLLSLVKNEMLQNMSQYDSGYFQLAITDLSDSVQNDAQLSQYAADLDTGVDAVTELSGKAYQLNRLTDRTISLGDTDDGILKKGETGYYRFDFFCQNLSSTVIAKYAASQNGAQADGSISFTLDAKITAQQANAPWSDSLESSAYTHEADSRESFLSAVESAKSGDTILLMSDIELEDAVNLTFYHRVNLNLNGHTLTVKGNLTYDYADSGICTLSMSAKSKLIVCGDFIIHAPNSAFSVTGDEAAAVQIGNADREGTFSVNCVRDYTDEQGGFVLDQVSVINATKSMAQDLVVEGDTAIHIGSGSVVGTITAAAGARNIAIVNNGSINRIDLSNMSFWNDGQSDQIYIKNNGQISTENPDGITLPSWSAGEVTSPQTSNTTVIQEAGTGKELEVRVCMDNVYYSAKNSRAFLDANAADKKSGLNPENIMFWNQDVTNNEIVVKVEKTAENMYVVYMDDENTDSVQKRMTDFFKSEAKKEYQDEEEVQQYAAEMAEALQSLTIKTYGSVKVVPEDFSYIKSAFPNIQTLDLSSAALEDDSIPAEAMKDTEHLRKLSLPETVRTIGEKAFYGCNIEELTLPASVTSVGTGAFQRDAKKTQKVYVTWNSENPIGKEVLHGFDTSYTRFFMSEYQALNLEELDLSWSAYVYERYDFVIRDGSALTFLKEVGGDDDSDYVRIVFYETSGAFDKSMIQSSYTPGDGTLYPYRGRTFYTRSIGVNAFRLIGEANPDKSVELLFPDTCTEIRANAFRPVTASHSYQIARLDLNYVNYIGENAFAYARIQYSKARPSGSNKKTAFAGMIYLGNGAFEGIAFYPADVEAPSEITASHFQGNSKGKTVYEAGTLDLSANRSAWTGDWSSAQPQQAIRNMTAAGCIIKLNNYYRLGDYGYQVNESSSPGIRLYGVWFDISGCEYLSKQVLKDSFPKIGNGGLQKYNVLDITNVKGFGSSAFENDYIGTVYAGVTDSFWQSEGAESFSWDAVSFDNSDTKGTVFANGSVLTLDIQGYMPTSAQSGVSIFGKAVYGTVNLHLLSKDASVTEYLLADSVVDKIRIYDVKNVTFGKSCFANTKSSTEGGVEIAVQAGGTVTFGEAAFYGAQIKSFDLAAGDNSKIEIGSEAFYGISFREMSSKDFAKFYGMISKNQNEALICGSTFPDDMKTLDLSADSVFAIRSDGQYRGCNMNRITSVVWKNETGDTGEAEENTPIAYDQVMCETIWPSLTSLSFAGVQLTGTGTFMNAKLSDVTSLALCSPYPGADDSTELHNRYLIAQSTFEGADLSSLASLDLRGVCVQSFAFRSAKLCAVTNIVTDKTQKTCMCNSAGTYDGQQFAHADFTGLKNTITWHVETMSRACFYDVRVGDGADWIFDDLTEFSGYLNFSGITEGKLRLEFPALTTCIPKGAAGDITRKQYLAQFDSSTAVYRIDFGTAFGKSGEIALGGSCTDTKGARIEDCSVGASSTEFRGMNDCTVYFANAEQVVQLFKAWDEAKLGTGVKFVVPQNLLAIYKEDANWRALASRISGDDRSYTAYTYVIVENSVDEVQLTGYIGEDVTLVVPETITVSYDSGDEMAGKTLRVTQLSEAFLSGSNRVKTLVLPSSLTYIDPALFDGTGVESIRFYSAENSGSTAAYYRAENDLSEKETLEGIGERTITSGGKLLLSGAGTLLLRAVPGASYEASEGDFYEIPAAVKGIGSGAFRGTGVTAISMKSVTSIAGDAFEGSAKDSNGNSIESLKFAMAVPPALSGDALKIFRTADQTGARVRLEGTIIVPGLDEKNQPTDIYLLAYQSAAGFTAYQSLVVADTSLAPCMDADGVRLSDETSLLIYTDGRGVTWYYTLDEEAQNAVLVGVKEGLPSNTEETFFLPAEVSDGRDWYPVSAIGFTEDQESYLKEIVRYEVVQQVNADGSLPQIAAQLYTDEYGVLYRIAPDLSGAVLLRYPAASELEAYTIPEKLVMGQTTVTGIMETQESSDSDADMRVAEIASYAFSNAASLKILYIPTSVLRRISIEENAFAGTDDAFTVFGGDGAKDDVVVLKTEVDQETWEKIQKWLSGEHIESDLPEEESPDKDSTQAPQSEAVDAAENTDTADDEGLTDAGVDAEADGYWDVNNQTEADDDADTDTGAEADIDDAAVGSIRDADIMDENIYYEDSSDIDDAGVDAEVVNPASSEEDAAMEEIQNADAAEDDGVETDGGVYADSSTATEILDDAASLNGIE